MEQPSGSQPVLDALVVGAGPVGLTLAAELLRHGLRCRIVDKSPAPTDQSRALVVWSRTLELLEKTGLAGRFLEAGFPMHGANIFGGGKRRVHLAIHAEQTHYPRPLAIPQSKTEQILNDHLARAGSPVERSVELVSFTDHGDTVEAMLRHAGGREETVRAAWLLGCDGAHSTVRHRLGVPFAGEAEPNDWVLADVRIDGPLPGNEVSVYWHRKGVLFFFPITPGRFRVVADQGLVHGADKPPDPTLEQVQAIADERGPGGLRVHDPVWLAGFRINERKVADYRRGRAFLLGDAAHVHSPAGGQGMNTGMQDAYNLAWKLALVQKGRARAALLDSYSPERSAVGEQVLRMAGGMTSLATLRNPVGQFVRNHLAALLGTLGPFRRRFTSALTELSIGYPHSPLNGEDWPRGLLRRSGGVRPGQRLPDAPLTEPGSSRPRRLLEVLTDPPHQLLVLPGTSNASLRRCPADLLAISEQVHRTFPGLVRTHLLVPGGALPARGDERRGDFDGVWWDSENTVHAQHAAGPPTLVLVRPDGYVGYRGRPVSWERLQEYLERYLVPGTAMRERGGLPAG
jgi:2-polyprenyl-6-methoxyphenol hydroxylase-like FAD-dependent oxidoreductase